MVMRIVGAVINIILGSHLFFGYFGLLAMGTRGAAIATVAGQDYSNAVGIIFLI